MFALFPTATINMKQPLQTSLQATPYLKPITFIWNTHTNNTIWSAQIAMLEDKKRPWVGSEAVHLNTCCKLWKKLRGPMDDGKRRGLMQLRLVVWLLHWNYQDISGFILTSVSEYSNTPSASLEDFGLGIYNQSNQHVAWAIKVQINENAEKPVFLDLLS